MRSHTDWRGEQVGALSGPDCEISHRLERGATRSAGPLSRRVLKTLRGSPKEKPKEDNIY